MSYFVRCPSSIELPDGAVVRCGEIKRIDVSLEREAVSHFLSCSTARCARCGSRFNTTAPEYGERFGSAQEPW